MKRFPLLLGACAAITVLVALAGLWLLRIPAPIATEPPPPSILPTPTPTPRPDPKLSVNAIVSADAVTITADISPAVQAAEALYWIDVPRWNESGLPFASASPGDGFSLRIEADELSLPPGDTDLVRDYWMGVRLRSGELLYESGTIDLGRLAEPPGAEPLAPAGVREWQRYATPHVEFRYVAGSAAERDIEKLGALAEAGYAQASGVISPTLLGAAAPVTTTIYLLPRVFWQGGAAYGDGVMLISYLDRNYTGVETWTYFVHELIHSLAGLQATDPTIEIGNLLGEGAAVYGTGGHYQREDVRARAAALARSGRLVDLCPLRLDWWDTQHEIAYVEGGSYVAYLVERFGLDAFLDHYLRQQPELPRGSGPKRFCAAFNEGIAEPFGVSHGELEAGWRAWLDATAPDPTVDRQWADTLRYYDLMRRYEETFDPAARILPDHPADWDRQLAVSMTVQLNGPALVARETMLIAADEALGSGDLARADALLDEVEASLDDPGAPLAGAFGREHQAINQLLQDYARARRIGAPAAMLEPGAAEPDALRPQQQAPLFPRFDLTLERLRVDGDRATALASVAAQRLGGEPAGGLYELELARSTDGWRIQAISQAEVALPGPPGADTVLPR
ncbi:MAG TPA: hypothetical protein VGE07_03095 [Herpetosiphonaceae bacterium]